MLFNLLVLVFFLHMRLNIYEKNSVIDWNIVSFIVDKNNDKILKWGETVIPYFTIIVIFSS